MRWGNLAQTKLSRWRQSVDTNTIKCSRKEKGRRGLCELGVPNCLMIVSTYHAFDAAHIDLIIF